jgi:hypothetical protein
VYDGNFFYDPWNDQFEGDPINTQSAPAGHSKGMLVWNNDGEGRVQAWICHEATAFSIYS